jgi:cytochrome c peroxidase
MDQQKFTKTMVARTEHSVENRGIGFYVFGLILLSAVLTPAFQRNPNRSYELSASVPAGISKELWRERIPADNPISAAKVELGRLLFFDKRLSSDGSLSCASCHDPANAFTDHNSVARGVAGKTGTRNAPTILNSMFSERLFWDGRVGSLEEQAKQPLTNQFEMGMGDYQEVVARLAKIPVYRKAFRRAFKIEGITIDLVVKAIASYERTQLSGNSPFDRFIAGDSVAMTAAQKRGWALFKAKAGCIECHTYTPTSPFFTDFNFHNTGITAAGINFDDLKIRVKEAARPGSEQTLRTLTHTEGISELGRYLSSQSPQDMGAFKTPPLRDIELTGPYMHNGSEKTLIDVVQFYNHGGLPNPNLDKRMQALNLTDQEANDVVEFLRALTSDDVLRQVQITNPQTREAVQLRTP